MKHFNLKKRGFKYICYVTLVKKGDTSLDSTLLIAGILILMVLLIIDLKIKN